MGISIETGDAETVLETYGLMVYKLALSQTRNRSDAQDVFQEVFLRLMKNNEYKSIMDHVEIPEDVWNQTLERMQSAGQPHGILLWKKAAVLCVLLVICGISVFTAVQLKKDSGPVFISALQEDSEFSYVELEEGVLTFDKTEKISNLQVQTGSIEGK